MVKKKVPGHLSVQQGSSSGCPT